MLINTSGEFVEIGFVLGFGTFTHSPEQGFGTSVVYESGKDGRLYEYYVERIQMLDGHYPET